MQYQCPVFCIFILITIPCSISLASTQRSQIETMANQGVSIMQDLLISPNSDVLITMNFPMDAIIQQFATTKYRSREEKSTAMVNAMRQSTATSQAPLLSQLAAFGIQATPLWLTNQIFVKGINPEMIQRIARLSGVLRIERDRLIPLPPIFDKIDAPAPNGTEWQLETMNVPKLWKMGIKGKGVVVASIDTGVRLPHTTIKDQYVGNNNHGWYDPILSLSQPADLHGHGTHTVGSMVGNNGIGAAPEAKWMACRGCGGAGCQQHALIACGQFMLCPSDPKSKALNCTNVPNIVNNSWGGPGGETSWFDHIINAWLAVGIIPFFAIGNSGPKCETAGTPGDSEYVIAIGATDRSDKLAKFSSRGPKMLVNRNSSNPGFLQMFFSAFQKNKIATEIIKPDVCAPGHEILSAGFLYNEGYVKMSGTSMASPLAAGGAALLVSEFPDLTVDDLKHVLFETAVKKLPLTGTEKCGGLEEDRFPNNLYGHGRIDIYAAYNKLKTIMKGKGKDGGTKKSMKSRKNEKPDPDPVKEMQEEDGQESEKEQSKKVSSDVSKEQSPESVENENEQLNEQSDNVSEEQGPESKENDKNSQE